jgi:hypothetical protein
VRINRERIGTRSTEHRRSAYEDFMCAPVQGYWECVNEFMWYTSLKISGDRLKRSVRSDCKLCKPAIV